MNIVAWVKEHYIKSALTMVFVAVWVKSCYPFDIKWKEEVQLSDGTVIVIDRILEVESGGDEWAANRSGSKPKGYLIRFNDPNNSERIIEWKSMKIDSATYPEIPLVLDKNKGEWLIFTTLGKSGGCLTYIKYINRGGAWVEEKLPATFEQHATNLFVIEEDLNSYIDLKTKQAIIKTHDSVRSSRYDQVGPTHPYCKGL